MGQVVYADLLFLIDFSMDFLCFYITARLLHRDLRLWRCLAGAAVGGIYSVAALFIRTNMFWGIVADLSVCAVMCLCAFGVPDRSMYGFFLRTSVYFGVSAGLGGFMTAIYSMLNRVNIESEDFSNVEDGVSVWMFGLMALISGIATMLWGRFFKSVSSVSVADVEITYEGKSISVRAFVDTGNMLSDPISGKAVIAVDKRKLEQERIISRESLEGAIKRKTDGMSSRECRRVRLIPMETASGSSMLVAFEPDRVTVTVSDKGKERKKAEVRALFAPIELSLPADKMAVGCSALLPQELVI